MSYQKKSAEWMMKYPAVSDLAARAKRRIPAIGWEYLITGTGAEELIDINVERFRKIRFQPRFCKGSPIAKLETTLFDQTYRAPFGIAPIGLTGLMWPRAEMLLAASANRCGIPCTLSTLATETPETVGPYVGDMGWFQLYAPRDPRDIRHILDRARTSGYKTLIITVDIPVPSRRERTKRAGLTDRAKLTPSLVWQAFTHPTWTWQTLQHGLPRLRTAEDYQGFVQDMSVGEFVEDQKGGNLTWDLCKQLAQEWDGPVLMKGLMHPDDARKAVDIGVDGIVVSNHGGRQFDGALSSIEVLPQMVEAVGKETTIVFDSGIRNGLDAMRALSLGADFVLLGRAFIYGVCALGAYGGDHVFQIIYDELANNMAQLGVNTLAELRGLAICQ